MTTPSDTSSSVESIDDDDATLVQQLELTRTIEARIALDPDLAQTVVRSPRKTIQEKHRAASARGLAALQALRELGAATNGRLSMHNTIGEGGMGVVHLATQTTLGRHVAVKTRRADAEASPDATLRILREAWVTGALEHPNVVPVYDVGVDGDGAPVIVMKRIEGRSWADLIREPDEIRARFGVTDPLEWNLRILITACNAVHFAHSRGILHRDLKPENVMVGAFGEVYVLDWGIAVSLTPDPSGRLPDVAEATAVVGTPAYMAPEMVMGDPALLSPRTDVYLLGAILYEIFSGGPPHDGPTLNAMLSRVLLSTPKYSSSFPAEAKAVCARALKRDPAERYATAEELRLALDAYLRHRESRRIASEARQSFDRLVEAIAGEPNEARALAVFNLLGECRFGYRSALSAWPENERARQGLDKALLAVIDHELAEGDPNAAAALLREVSSAPPEVAKRVEAAARARAAEDERLRKLDADADPTIGGRTRSFIAGILGFLWIAMPLVGWVLELRGRRMLTHEATIGISCFVFALTAAFGVWARDTLTKTQFNRRVGRTLIFYLGAQVLLVVGASFANLAPEMALSIMMFAWSITEAALAIWVEPWFALSAAVALGSFFVTIVRPKLALPLLSIDSVALALVVQLAWFPRQDLERIRERRRELHRRARRWFMAEQ